MRLHFKRFNILTQLFNKFINSFTRISTALKTAFYIIKNELCLLSSKLFYSKYVYMQYYETTNKIINTIYNPHNEAKYCRNVYGNIILFRDTNRQAESIVHF